MKIFIWLCTLALGLLCWFGYGISHLVVANLKSFHSGEALPAITRVLLFPREWMIWYPLPWVLAAGVLSWRRELPVGPALVFGGVALLGMTLFFSGVTAACVVPYVSYKCCGK